MGGALGGVASRLGVEDIVARGIAGKSAAGGVSALRRLGVGAVSEGVPEAIQGGQERHASNVALQREGFDTPTWQGVAGQATAEGVAGGMLGGASNAFARGTRPALEQPPVNSDLTLEPVSSLAEGAPATGPQPQAGVAPSVPTTIHPDDNPETGVDPELSPVAQSGLNPADGPLSRNVVKEMGRGALPVDQPVQAPRPIGERIRELPEQARTQAIILADEINNLDAPDGVRQFRRAELDTLLQQHEQSTSAGNGPISRGLTAHRPSTALATSELTASDPADWHKTYRRNPVGVPYQNSADPLEGVQQAVREGTQYTGQDQVQSVRNELDDAWLALNVGDEPVQPSEPTALPAQDQGDITPEIDARVRAGRVVSGVRNAFDGGAPNTLRVIQQVNQALRTIGEQSLTQDEITRVRRVADARTAFMGLNLPAPLPSDRTQPVPPVDALADNSAMEALIPERQASAQRLVGGGAQIASSQSQTRVDEGVARGAQTEQSVPAANADITGARVDGDWVAFSPASGSLGVPRVQMPQIDAAHRGALVNYLKGQGVASEQAEVPAHSLKPTQAEFSDAKVLKAAIRAGGDRSVLVSSDGYVVDGHHQWLAKRQAGEAVKVLQLQAPISELLPMVGDFPSVRTADGATDVTEDLRPEVAGALAFSEPLPELSASNAPSNFVAAPGGSLDFGEITPAMARVMRRQAGKIRLQQGVQNADGTGWGLAHIEANHGAQIRALGMDVPAFVAQVASGIEQVWQVPGNRQLLVTLKDGRKDVMYIQLDLAKEGDFYRVNSAFPVRQQDYEARRGMKKVWDGSEPTSAVTGQRPAYATAASAAPESVSSQGSSNARGQESSVAQPIESPQAAGPLFSSRSTAPEAKLSLERVQQLVNTALTGIPGAPPVFVVGSPADIGLVTSGEDVHSGVTLRSGDIYVFQSGVGSELDVLKTVFHELLHRGLRNILPADQYVQTMLDLAKRDSRVQSYANAWKRLSIAAEQRAELSNMGFSGSELQARFEALAIEEGLAVVAEELKAEKQAGTRSVHLRALTNWMAGIADKLGLSSVGNALRRMSYNEAERFVLSAIAASGQAIAPSTAQSSQAGAGVNNMRTALPEGLAKAVGDSIKGMTVQNVRKQAGFKLTDYMGLGLQFLGRRQLVEVYGTALPQLSKYSDLMARMDADKNEAGAGADQLATEWGQLADEKQLAEVMHDATVAQIDPTKDYVEGDNKTDWKALKARYEALSPQARDIFTRASGSYSSHMREVRQAIKERIDRSGMTEQRKADMIKQMDGDFFGHVKGVYFPLARFGQYVVVVKDNLGKAVNVSRAETMAEADQLRTTLASAYSRGQGFTVGKVLKAKDFVADRDTVDSGFIKELYGVLDKQGMDAAQRAELEDSIGQLYLASMPDLSWAKHGIHRKGTAGFSQNARRAFAQNTFHGARYLAKLRYSDLLQDELTAMDEHIAMRDSSPTYPSVRARQVLDEMVKRHDAAMNPNGHPLSTALTSFGFMFHLGLSPASALVNMTQTALVAYPVMGAKWGFAKAGDALLRASKETVQGKNDIAAYLNKDEKAAYDEAVRSGVIDVTMAHDLAGIAQGEDSGVMWKIRPMMKWASFLFHHAEKFNRQATFVAAYRLARDSGTAHLKAYEEAVKATYDGHFDYSSNNRPRIMQGNAARVLLLFKQYAQNMVYAFARSAQQSMKGQSAKERAEARKVLGGLLVMHGMAAGALGLPMVSTLLAVASMLGGDDDEPFDAQTALQNMLADTFGQKPAEVMAHGLSRLTPWDISGRVGLDNLIFPDLQEGLEGQRLAESAMAAALGPVAGIGTNVLRGVQSMAEGHYLRGLESMMPSFLRGPLKSIRYGSEGVQDKSGIVVKDDVDFAGQVGQFMGFSPSEVRLAFEGKAAINKHDRTLGARRSTLMEQYALAAMAGDEEGKTEAREAITRFNEKNPSRMIKPLQLGQSIRMRQRRIDQAQEGVYLPRNRRDALEAGRFVIQD